MLRSIEMNRRSFKMMILAVLVALCWLAKPGGLECAEEPADGATAGRNARKVVKGRAQLYGVWELVSTISGDTAAAPDRKRSFTFHPNRLSIEDAGQKAQDVSFLLDTSVTPTRLRYTQPTDPEKSVHLIVRLEDGQLITARYAGERGRWELESITENGNKRAPAESETLSLFFMGDRIGTLPADLGLEAPVRYHRYAINEAKHPKHLDYEFDVERPGTYIKAIYSLEGDVLHICFSVDEFRQTENRPESLAATETNRITSYSRSPSMPILK